VSILGQSMFIAGVAVGLCISYPLVILLLTFSSLYF
jgi:hypothetical protein